MNSLDLDDSALCTLPVIQKRKATVNISLKKLKQAKLDIGVTLENNEPKQLDENLKLNESTSSYFKKKNSNICPLCLRVIESDGGFMIHTKSCAKKHNMTTQELLKALDLQKKHMEERRELGLSSQVVPWNKKINNKGEKNLDSYDVALGIALSKSLEELKPAERGKATLEEFGFKTTQVSTSTGRSRFKIWRKNKLLQKSVLKLRTAEERQRIITEKVAVVLLDQDAENNFEKKTAEKMELNEVLGDIVNEVPHLWNLGENDGKFDWYIKEMKPLIQIEEKVPEICEKEETHLFLNPSFVNSGPSFPKDIRNAVSQLNLPNENLSADWRKMINNSKLSDLVGKTKDSQTVYLHSVVLQARCANILEKDYQSVFEKFNLLTVLVFLEFLYCGTLNSLSGSEVKNLSLLAGEFDYEELIKVLNCLKKSEDFEQNPQEEIATAENNSELISPEDGDLFVEDMVDLTQSSHSTNDEKYSEDESNIEKSFWSFIQQEKKREEELRKEEEKESSLLCIEREKIETNMKERDEQMQKILECEEESDFKDSLELEKICGSQRTSSPVSAFKENMSDCIILSSDSETRLSKSPDLKILSPANLDYDVHCFDPYDDVIACSELSPVNSFSESLISGSILRQSPPGPQEDTPGYCSTPLTKGQNSMAQSLSKKPLVKKKRSNLSASRIIRKSLHLQQKKRNSISVKRKTLKRKSVKENKSLKVLSDSVLHDLSKSFTCRASSPKSLKNFVELTPKPGVDEFGESVTPSPNYSNMGDSVLKEHLSRFGLKRSMGKSKAKKILRHIYEELHPRINTETGKILKAMPNNTPVKKKKTIAQKKMGKRVRKEKPGEQKAKSGNFSKETFKASDESLDRSIDDSNGSEFEDLDEPLTQSVPNNPVDLPSAFREFIENNSEFYTKILSYEPIWLEDLQSKLKERFQKHFKLSDLMDYLDQKCITFRTHAQRKVNQKRAEMKQSPQKKTSR